MNQTNNGRGEKCINSRSLCLPFIIVKCFAPEPQLMRVVEGEVTTFVDILLNRVATELTYKTSESLKRLFLV